MNEPVPHYTVQMARQIDAIQNYLRQQDGNFASAPPAFSVVSVQQGTSAMSPFLAAAAQQPGALGRLMSWQAAGGGVGGASGAQRELISVGSVVTRETQQQPLPGQH